MKFTDQRVKAISEMVTGMKVGLRCMQHESCGLVLWLSLIQKGSDAGFRCSTGNQALCLGGALQEACHQYS